MTKLTYREQLLHPNWQKRRLEIFERDEFKCQSCGDTETTLHVHHKHYIKGRLAWEYADEELVTLCAPCHSEQDSRDEEQKMLLARLPLDGPANIRSALGLVAGYAHNLCGYDLSDWFGSAPRYFVVGEIACLIDDFNIHVLLDLEKALRALTPDEREAAFRRFVQTLSEGG